MPVSLATSSVLRVGTLTAGCGVWMCVVCRVCRAHSLQSSAVLATTAMLATLPRPLSCGETKIPSVTQGQASASEAYWGNRWAKGHTGWQRPSVHEALLQHHRHLTGSLHACLSCLVCWPRPDGMHRQWCVRPRRGGAWLPWVRLGQVFMEFLDCPPCMT